MQRDCCVRSYKLKHSYDIKNFLNDYTRLLQKAIDIIWDNIKWIEKKQRKYYRVNKEKKYYFVKRLKPEIPKSRAFKRDLRNNLLKDWDYAAHYVDSAIRVAYSILASWKKNYLRGRRRRKKPTVRRKFIRVKGTLFVCKDGRIRVTIKPGEYLAFEYSNAWFKKRVEGWRLGELILKEDEIVITFKKEKEEEIKDTAIGWDLNLFSLDGFSPRYGWIKVDLSHLYHIHRVHEIKRKKAQSKASKKHSLKSVVTKHGRRERNRAEDLVHKLTTQIARMFKCAHAFEKLDKKGMFSRGRKHNRDISKQNWRTIVQYMRYKSEVKLVSAKGTTSTCPMCGGSMKLRKGWVVCKKCGLTLDRQLCGAINIYLRMCGFPQHPSVFFRSVVRPLMRSMKKRKCAMTLGGVATKGGESDDMPPMNPRGGLSLMNPKAHICVYVS